MQCPYCGSSDPGSGAFCKNCGGQLPKNPAPQTNPTYTDPNQGYYNPNAPQSYAPTQPQYTNQYQIPNAQPKENVFLGLIGALLGSLIGAVSIVLLGQLGFVASISGWLLAICTLKGYELLGKRLGTAGIVASIILLILMPLVGFLGKVTVDVMRAFSAGPAEALPFALEIAFSGDYIKDLLMLYLFVALGGIPIISNVIRASKQ